MELRGRAAGNAASPERMLFGGRLGVVVVHAFRSFGLFKGLGAYGGHDGLGDDMLVGSPS